VSKPLRAFLVAGEPSGDRLGAALLAGLKELSPGIVFDGVGGSAMAAEGLSSRFPMRDLSVMGIVEVLPKYRALRRRMIETADAVIAARPDVLITIDSPDFCLRVAARVRAASAQRIVHYVAPSVWAWRPGRAAKMARHVDQVLTLLPFEPPYMEAAGMRADFTGHPVVAEPVPTAAEVSAFRRLHQLGEAPVLLVLPGSRQSEVARLMPVFGAALAEVHSARPDLRVVLPAAGPVAQAVAEAAQGWPGAPLVLDPTGLSDAQGGARKRAAFAAATVALAASGTVSLELAAAATPMVVAYSMSALSWQIMKRMALIDTVTLVNLVSETRVVPEFLGPACQPAPIAAALLDLLGDAAAQTAQRRAMALTMQRLGQGGEPPGLRAARAVLEGLEASVGRTPQAD
jgi:lipid-A-disaccharide synthase